MFCNFVKIGCQIKQNLRFIAIKWWSWFYIKVLIKVVLDMFKSYKRICLLLKLLCWPLFTFFCVSNTSAHTTFYSYTSRPEVIYFQKRDNDSAHLLYCRNLLEKRRKTISLRTEEYRLKIKQKFREKYRLHWLQKITMIKIW